MKNTVKDWTVLIYEGIQTDDTVKTILAIYLHTRDLAEGGNQGAVFDLLYRARKRHTLQAIALATANDLRTVQRYKKHFAQMAERISSTAQSLSDLRLRYVETGQILSLLDE